MLNVDWKLSSTSHRRRTPNSFPIAAEATPSGTVRDAVLETGTAEILVTEKRHEPFDVGCFTHAGVDPAKKHYILIKSCQHFRAGFKPILKHVIMVSGPGITTSD